MRDTILILDDDDDLREILVDLFQISDLKAIGFSNVTDAKKYLATLSNSEKIQSIISDYMLGATNGIDFLNHVKNTPELTAIDFYLLTGASTEDFETHLKSNRLKAVIEKPFDTQDLINLFLKDKSQKSAA